MLELKENFFLIRQLYGNIWSYSKNATSQGDAYRTGYLLDYFKYYYKVIAMDVSKQQALDAALKVIQQINLIGNLQAQTKYLQ